MSQILPPAALQQHIAVLGKTGSGKSSVLRAIVEGLLDAGKPVCIIDPKGDWWGLKSSADGKKAGYPVVIFGGEHADVPLNAHAGAHVAELVATGNRPCIIDLGGWMVGDRTRFFIDFASTLFRHSRGPRWLVIDEVHNFAPQGKVLDPDAGKMLHWANRLASEGRGKGLTLLAASQRPQKVHKDFLTSAETLIAMRVIHPLDRGAIKDWIDGCPDPAKGREVLGSLASMKRGEGWVWSPEIGFGPQHVQFPKFKTYDSFAAPVGEATAKLAGWAEVDLDDVKAKLASVVQEAEANNPKLLRAEVARLRSELAKTPTNVPDAAELEEAEKRGYRSGQLAERQISVDVIGQIRVEVESAFDSALLPPIPAAPALDRRSIAAKQMLDRVAAMPAREMQARHKTAGAAGGAATLPKGERIVLTAIAQHIDGATREQLTVLTGYKRSSRDAYIQRLRERELISASGERLVVTNDGIAALGSDFEPLPTGDALLAHWLENLPEGERRILKIVAEVYPGAIERESISKATNYQRSSRDAYLQRLSARRLIVSKGRGQVRASEELFG